MEPETSSEHTLTFGVQSLYTNKDQGEDTAGSAYVVELDRRNFFPPPG